jgi:uncharacterized protein YbjT (DUF2867 family)
MTDRAAYIAGLRQLADALEAHPGIPLPVTEMTIHFMRVDDPRTALAEAARAFPCAWRKRAWTGESGQSYFDLNGRLAGLSLKLSAYRDAVCTRVVTGTEDREVEEVVTPALTRKVTKPVEVVEWECSPILAGTMPGSAA